MTQKPKRDGFAIAAQLNEAVAPAATPQDNAPPAAAKRRGSASRPNRKFIGGYFPANMHRALRMTMVEENTTIEALVEEAIADLLVKKGKTKHLNM